MVEIEINLASLQGASIIQFNAGVYFSIMHFLGTRNVCFVPVNNYLDQGKLYSPKSVQIDFQDFGSGKMIGRLKVTCMRPLMLLDVSVSP